MDDQLSQAGIFIDEHDHFIVVSHINPDGDALGSLLAVADLLHTQGKTFSLACDGYLPQRFRFLPRFEEIMSCDELSVHHDVGEASVNRVGLISIDVADEQRLGDLPPRVMQYERLNIDHHPTNTRFGSVNVVHSSAASTTQVLYDLYRLCFPDALNQATSICLYTGLLTDTGGFRYSNTNHDVMKMAADLLTYEVDPHLIAERSLETMSLPQYELIKNCLPLLRFACNGKVGIIPVSTNIMKLSGANKDDIDGLVNYPRMLEGVLIAAVLKEWSTDEIKVSLRSKGNLDVARVAASFGGGGHAKASGFTYSGTLEEANDALLDELEKVLEEV